jgi:hypothetical protein
MEKALNPYASYENNIEWITGETSVSAYFTQKRFINLIKKLSEKEPDKVIISHINQDGSIVAEFPLDYVSVRKPREINLTDEQKQAIKERLERGRNASTTGEN